MQITNVNFVIKDLMEKQISINILSQFMKEINHMKETFWKQCILQMWTLSWRIWWGNKFQQAYWVSSWGKYTIWKKPFESNAPYKCELCHEGFDGETNFNRHIESVHEGNKPYERNLLKAMHLTNVNYVMKDFFWPLSISKQKGFVYWLNFQWRLCANPFLKKLTAGLPKVNLPTLQTTITKVTMGWKLLLYDCLFFSKQCFFRIFSTHCGKICMKKAFHLVEHGWLLPYGGTFFLNITTSENFQPMFNNMHQWLRGGAMGQ